MLWPGRVQDLEGKLKKARVVFAELLLLLGGVRLAGYTLIMQCLLPQTSARTQRQQLAMELRCEVHLLRRDASPGSLHCRAVLACLTMMYGDDASVNGNAQAETGCQMSRAGLQTSDN